MIEPTPRPAAPDPTAESDALPLRLRWGLVFAAAVMALGMVGHLSGHAHGQSPHLGVLSLGLTVCVAFLVGRETLAGLVHELRSRSPGRSALMAVTIFGAFAYSVATLAKTWRTDESAGVYFEVVAFVLVAGSLGRWLHASALRLSAEARSRLQQAAPPTAHKLEEGVVAEVPSDSLAVGDLVLVRPEERFPADGVIVEGGTSVDESQATGEWVPVVRTVGDRVIVGTRNVQSDVRVRLKAPAATVTHAPLNRDVTPHRSFEDLTARALLGLAALLVPASLGWWGFLRGDWWFAVHAALSLMIVACPCALVLARPLALHRATIEAARAGILIRDVHALELLATVNTMVFDKTGTLTKGFPIMEGCHNFEFFTDDSVLAMAASAERGSEHPLGRAIHEAAVAKGLDLPTVHETRQLPGEGVAARLESGVEILVGNSTLLERVGVYFPAKQTIDRINAEFEGKSIVWVARAATHFKEPVGMIIFRDELKPGASDSLRELRVRFGTDLWVVSGDHERAVVSACQTLPVPPSHVVGDASPSAKADKVRSLRSEGDVVAFVGDGTNDTSALRKAEVGIALGTGAEAARDACHVMLASSDLQGLGKLLGIARACRARVVRNVTAAVSLYALMLPLAALGKLTPLAASIAMIATSLLLLGTQRSRIGPSAAPLPPQARRTS